VWTQIREAVSFVDRKCGPMKYATVAVLLKLLQLIEEYSTRDASVGAIVFLGANAVKELRIL